MTAALELSLEDIIKKNRSTRTSTRARGGGAGRRQRGGSGGSGPIRKRTGGGRQNGRPTPYQAQQQKKLLQLQKKSESLIRSQLNQTKKQGGGLTATNKIIVSNLDNQLIEEDIIEIFGNVGRVVSAALYHDKNGRSRGLCEVTFQRKQDALRAVDEYDSAEVDGVAMYVKVLALHKPTVTLKANGRSTSNTERQLQNIMQQQTQLLKQSISSPPPQSSSSNNTITRATRGGRGRGGKARGAGGAAGRGRGRGERKQSKTQEDLDAEMDAYFNSNATNNTTTTSTETMTAGQPVIPSLDNSSSSSMLTAANGVKAVSE